MGINRSFITFEPLWAFWVVLSLFMPSHARANKDSEEEPARPLAYEFRDPYQDPQRFHLDEVLRPVTPTPNTDRPNPNEYIELAFVDPVLDAYLDLVRDPTYDSTNVEEDALTLRRLLLGRIRHMRNTPLRRLLPHERAFARSVRRTQAYYLNQAVLKTLSDRFRALVIQSPQAHATEIVALFKMGLVFSALHVADRRKEIEERLHDRPVSWGASVSAGLVLTAVARTDPTTLAVAFSGALLTSLYSTIGYGMVRAFRGESHILYETRLRDEAESLRIYFLMRALEGFPNSIKKAIFEASTARNYSEIPRILCAQSFTRASGAESSPYRTRAPSTHEMVETIDAPTTVRSPRLNEVDE